jgi:hypothetical protein
MSHFFFIRSLRFLRPCVPLSTFAFLSVVNDPEVTKKIREATGNDLRHAADCMSGTETKLVNDCMGDARGVMSGSGSGISKGVNLPKNVKLKVSMSYNLLGEVRNPPSLYFVLLIKH